jgi:feruloyl esterase
MGCSKGGQEALQAMQSYGQEYDGIVAGAPAMHLPHAAIAQIHDVQAFAAIAPTLKNGKPDLSQSFTPTDLELVTQGIAEQCSGQDGSNDQQVVQPEQCHFKPEVLQCRGEKNAQCLSTGQVTALKSIFESTYASSGKKIYPGFPYDMGISSPGWRTWKLGDGQRPSLNEVLGGGSLAQVFMTPPVDAIDVYTHSLDALNQAIYATSKDFPQSAVDLVETDDSELKDFRARQGKLILYHGLGDPVFSAFDTLDYFKRLGSRHGDRTKEFASLYLIPGMTHCGGGDYALDTFDTLEPIVTWVEKGQAPAKLTAQAGVRSGAKLPQGIQSRAVCPYPKTPHLVDPAHAENAAAFACE